MKVFKAAQTQKDAYDGVYPLHGFVKVGDKVCTLEDLRSWPKGDPQWELLAPDGYRFEPEGTHTLLADSLQDLQDRLNGVSLVKCHCELANCDNHWKGQEI